MLAEARELSAVFSKGANPFHGGSALKTQSPPKFSLPSAFPLGIRFHYVSVGEGHKDCRNQWEKEKVIAVLVYSVKLSPEPGT